MDRDHTHMTREETWHTLIELKAVEGGLLADGISVKPISAEPISAKLNKDDILNIATSVFSQSCRTTVSSGTKGTQHSSEF
jgi:hypothetical protein